MDRGGYGDNSGNEVMQYVYEIVPKREQAKSNNELFLLTDRIRRVLVSWRYLCKRP